MELTIVHSNDLIEASYNLSIDEMRLISYVATQIDSRKANVGEVKIYPSEFADAFGLNRNNMHRNLNNAIKSLATKAVTMPLDNKRNIVLPWLGMGIYDRQPNDSSHVIVAFSQYIEPYLFELKNHFTVTKFEQTVKLNTPFSFRLYQWLIKARNLEHSKVGQSIQIVLEIDWIKKQAALNNKYNDWRNFSKFVIQPAIDKINLNTDISVIWKPLKKGRQIFAIQFNYVLEKDPSCIKPIRPRLYRRPKVMKGTHEEGVWMRKNLALLLEYEAQLKRYDDKEKLALTDLRKIAEYASICDRITEDRARKEIELRTIK